jgi:hypothetical protein
MTTATPVARKPAYGLVAGVGLLVLAVLAGLANFGVIERLVTEDDAAKTAADIAASEGSFRWAIAALVLVTILDVVVAWALREFFLAVDPGISTLAAWLRVAYAGVFAVAVGQLLGVPRALDSPDEVLSQVNAFQDIWKVSLVFFGAHLLLIGYLAYRSATVPGWIGVLIVVAGLGYLIDSFAAFLIADPAFEVSTVTFVGEALLMVWLLVRRWRGPGFLDR